MKVLSLHASPERGFPRPEVKSVELVAGKGVRGDRKAGKRENRAVLLMGQSTYDHLKSIGLETGGASLAETSERCLPSQEVSSTLELPHGALGENIVLDLDPHTLEPGTRLRIGDAVLEISLYCTPCKTLRDRYGQDFPHRLGKRRGMLAKVLEGGTIHPGDAVEILS